MTTAPHEEPSLAHLSWRLDRLSGEVRASGDATVAAMAGIRAEMHESLSRLRTELSERVLREVHDVHVEAHSSRLSTLERWRERIGTTILALLGIAATLLVGAGTVLATAIWH